jgi:hypothetical protein
VLLRITISFCGKKILDLIGKVLKKKSMIRIFIDRRNSIIIRHFNLSMTLLKTKPICARKPNASATHPDDRGPQAHGYRPCMHLP